MVSEIFELTLSELDLNNADVLADVFYDIAQKSESQKQLTENLTLLRDDFIERGKKHVFDKWFAGAKAQIPVEEMHGFEWRFRYSFEDFANSDDPYHEVFTQDTPFSKQRTLDRLAVEAAKVGYKGFKTTYKAYEKSMRLTTSSNNSLVNPSDFPWQPLELECGEWLCNADGIARVTPNNVEYACRHPIMPVERLINIDTGEEKLKIAFVRIKDNMVNTKWRELIVPKTSLFNSSKVVELAAYGVAVSSESAKLFSKAMCDLETFNENIIPEIQSVGRLGYIGEGKFSPYVDNIVFDGDASYGNIYDAISKRGSYTDWLAEAQKCRTETLTARIMLAASFASPLIAKIGALPFFVHLWGVDSGTGKTVALMLAASVWGNPEVGQYIQTFNATQVGHEKTAAFLNNIPMIIDELQLSKDSHGKSRFDVYQLAQGAGRTRGNKAGGVDKTPTWRLSILTSGESPIVNEAQGAGAHNRTIDIECKASEKAILDGYRTSSCVKNNYGFAGEMFVKALTDEVIEEAKGKYLELTKTLNETQTTEKQAMAAAILIIADELADRFIFKSGKHLTIKEISEFLKDKATASAGNRGYAFIKDWISINSNKFERKGEDGFQIKPSGDVYGIIENDWVYINKTKFSEALTAQGFDYRAIVSWLNSNKLIETRGRNMTRGKRLNGVLTECIKLFITENDEETIDGFVKLL